MAARRATVARNGSPAKAGQEAGPGYARHYDVVSGRQRNVRDLDRIVHDRTRLSIVSALAVNDSMTFTELKAATQTTDGNLSVHARKLEDAGYVSCTKSFDGRVPRTDFTLTAAGRRALQK